MRLKIKLCSLLVFAPAILFATTRWQTTREGFRSGACHLETNKLRITVHQCHVDIEEEAIIRAVGEVNWGDPASLEITGDFSMTPGTAVRSMLLWNGSTILKARLKHREEADSAYEEVVDRQRQIQFPRDPALIEYLGDGRYQYKIYPVAIGETRRIRILYTVPLRAIGQSFGFEIRTAFTHGAQSHPDYIPVTIKKGESTITNYYLRNGDSAKRIRSEGVHQIPYSSLALRYRNGRATPFFIMPGSGIINTAYTRHIDSGDSQGHYAALFAAIPDTVQTKLDELLLTASNSTLELTVGVGGSNHFIDLDQNTAGLGIYTKADAPWDSLLHWSVYDRNGIPKIDFTQKLAPNAELSQSAALPLVWAAKYSLDDEAGALGALYGFVDREMSLLALEEDILPDAQADRYADEGVPALLANEIIINPDKKPAAPRENIIVEHVTPVMTAMNRMARMLTVRMLANSMLLVDFGAPVAGKIELALYDCNGRKIAQWRDLEGMSGAVRIALPETVRGRYLLRVTSGGHTVSKKLIVR